MGRRIYWKTISIRSEFSSGLLTKVTWKDYYLTYKYTYYSERFTTSSNELTNRDRLTAYYMNDVSIGRNIKASSVNLDLKYLSIIYLTKTMNQF